MRRRLVLAVGAVMVAAVPAIAATDVKSGSPAWITRAVANHLYAEGRGIDQMANPAYAVKFAPHLAAYLASGQSPEATATASTDPFRLDWDRGRTRPVSYRNRYGARISAHLWAPPENAGPGPFPAVVIVTGYGGTENSLWWAAQSLAEAGYVVLTFDPQGFGLSDVYPSPRSVYCDPNGAWRQPQEMGLRETGRCAGMDNVPPEDVVRFLLFGVDWDELRAAYDGFAARFALGALDAAAWLLSAANPWQNLVDASRLGIAGHSAGAYGALLAGNGDPLHRFDAVVTWDGYGTMPKQVAPSVPTMFQVGEQENLLGPYLTQPAEPPPWAQNESRFVTGGVDVRRVALRGSTHQEWTTIPYGLVNPLCAPFCNASRDGQIVATHQTLAWFDRFVKGDASAALRLTQRVFDASADVHSIGQGKWNPLTQQNVPYTIAGEKVASHLSFYFRSFSRTAEYSCADLRRGCG
jgi:dienelactone hydrolase